MPKVVALRAEQPDATTAVLRKVPRRPPNSEVRSREYLTLGEVTKMIHAAGSVGRHQHRDKTLILMMFRHGLRVTEVVDLRWDQIDLKAGRIHVNRLKKGNPSMHFLEGDEIRALRRLAKAARSSSGGVVGAFVFMTERGGPMTRSTVNKFIERAGRNADLGFPVHPHMLRHACGFYLAHTGLDTRLIQDYLGHKNIAHTVRYTQLTPDRFKGLWK